VQQAGPMERVEAVGELLQRRPEPGHVSPAGRAGPRVNGRRGRGLERPANEVERLPALHARRRASRPLLRHRAARFSLHKLATDVGQEIGALDEVHGQEPLLPVGEQLVGADQVRVNKVGQRPKLPLEARHDRRLHGAQPLEGHQRAERLVARAEDHAEAAGPEAVENLETVTGVGSSFRGRFRAHRRDSITEAVSRRVPVLLVPGLACPLHASDGGESRGPR